jgi:uncharacterized membrane protein YedE/YeeE
MDVFPQSALPVEAPRAHAAIPDWARLGVLFGLLSAASIALWGPIGVSSTYPRLVGAALRWIAPGWAGANAYLVKMGELAKPESFLVLGLLIGGFAASRLSRQPAPAPVAVHPGEKRRALRYRDAFVGGFLIIFGARLAGGCTSGHIISGITQLSVAGMVFGAGVFATGILTARLLKTGGR